MGPDFFGPKSTSLIHVCHQTYLETAILFYKINRFALWGLGLDQIQDFLKRRKIAQIAVMKNVRSLSTPRDEDSNASAVEWMQYKVLPRRLKHETESWSLWFR
jgi:hypothetical protein